MENTKSLSSKAYQFSDDIPRNIQNDVIPIGPHFQADLPVFTGQVYDESDTSHWLGTKVWPVHNMRSRVHNKDLAPRENVYEVGKGRVDVCKCRVPKSSECIKRHVAYNNKKLQVELGQAFLDWKFDEMGEDASRDLTSKEKKKLASLLGKNPTKKKGEGFVEYALKALPNVRREAIVGYYFNTIVPRKISRKVRSGFEPTDIGTDDDDEDEKIGTDDDDEDEKTKASSSKSNHTRKRSRSESKTGKKYMVLSR